MALKTIITNMSTGFYSRARDFRRNLFSIALWICLIFPGRSGTLNAAPVNPPTDTGPTSAPAPETANPGPTAEGTPEPQAGAPPAAEDPPVTTPEPEIEPVAAPPPQKKERVGYAAVLMNQLRRSAVGLGTGLSFTHFGGDEEIAGGNRDWLPVGLYLESYVWNYPKFLKGRWSATGVALFTDINWGGLDFQLRDGDREFDFSGRQVYVLFGGKVDLVRLDPWMKWLPGGHATAHARLAYSHSLNLEGKIQYPGDEEEYFIASLNNQYGLALGLGTEWAWRDLALGLDFYYDFHFNDYQAGRGFSFTLANPDLKNLVTGPITQNQARLQATILYKFQSL